MELKWFNQTTVNLLAWIWRRTPRLLRGVTIWLLRPKMMVGVAGILLNEREEVLLLRHRFHARDPWGLPGGWLDRREPITAGWRREVREETGLEIEILGLVSEGASFFTLEFIFLGRVTGGILTPDPKEILEARFFAPNQLPAGLQEEHQQVIRHLFAQPRPEDGVHLLRIV
jgi:ADP-ribose pyrophosphatase YjhB (NUDIX family)